MLENDVLRGAQRNYYAVRLVALCAATAVIVAVVVGIATTLLVTSHTNGVIYDNAVTGCLRNNAVRAESNQRIAEHTLDARNLAQLAHRLSANRAREASTFSAIGGTFNIGDKVAPLVRLLTNASREDQQIADAQDQVVFRALPIVACNDTSVVQRP